MYFYDANKPHLNNHPSREKALADFVNNKHHLMINYGWVDLCFRNGTSRSYTLVYSLHTYPCYRKEGIFFSSTKTFCHLMSYSFYCML